MNLYTKTGLLIANMAFVVFNISGQHPEPEDFNVLLTNYNVAHITWQLPVIADETVFQVGFELGNIPASWTLIDQDGDAEQWEIHPSGWSAPHTGSYSIASYSWFNGNALSPENWLISPAITIPANAQLEYWISAISSTYSNEHYQVRVSTSGTSISDFNTILVDETLPQNNNLWQQRTRNLSQFTGQIIHLAFVHNFSTNILDRKSDV